MDSKRTLFQRYLAYRRTICSPLTVQGNRYALESWECFLAQQGIGPQKATRKHCEEYMAGRSMAPSTHHNVVATLRKFYDWLQDHEITKENPWSDIATPRQPTRIPKILSWEELAKIDAALDAPTVRALRDRSLVAFLYATACRNSEAQGLDLNKISLERREAVVLGKGNKERVVFFGEDTAHKLGAWLKVRCKWAPEFSGPVWVGRHGKRIAKTAARDALIRAARDAGISRHLWPHLLRHTQATHLLQAGMNIRELQLLLGHADLSSTEIYTHVQPGELHAAYDKVSQGGKSHVNMGRHTV